MAKKHRCESDTCLMCVRDDRDQHKQDFLTACDQAGKAGKVLLVVSQERDRLKRELGTLNTDFERVVEESNRHREVLADVANVIGKRLKETEE